MERIPASERTREQLKALMEGEAEATESNSDLVRLAARLIIEEAYSIDPSALFSRPGRKPLR